MSATLEHIAGWNRAALAERFPAAAPLPERHWPMGWEAIDARGGGLKQAAVLSQAGLTQASADRLARAVEQAESKLPAEQVKKFSLFGAMVPVDHRHGDSSGAHRP